MRIRNRINPPKSRSVQNRCQEVFFRIPANATVDKALGPQAVVLFPNWCSQATSSVPLFPCSHVPIGFPRSLQLSVPMFPMGFPDRNISRVPNGSHVPEQVPGSNFQVAGAQHFLSEERLKSFTEHLHVAHKRAQQLLVRRQD